MIIEIYKKKVDSNFFYLSLDVAQKKGKQIRGGGDLKTTFRHGFTCTYSFSKLRNPRIPWRYWIETRTMS